MTTTTARPEAMTENEACDIQSENLTLGVPLARIFGLDSQGQGRAIVNVAEDKKSKRQFAVKRFSNLMFKNSPNSIIHFVLRVMESFKLSVKSENYRSS